MYQDIDDIDAEDGPDAESRRPLWRQPKGLLALACLVLIVLIWAVALRPETPDPVDVNLSKNQAAEKAYRMAISEQDPALRRARLSDYLLTIENGPHETAVLAQIDVINRYEGTDWEQVQLTAYNPRLSKEVKLGTLQRYEEKWGGSLLGGREDDIERLRQEIIQTKNPEISPDKSLDGELSVIPETVPDNFLAGGPGYDGADISGNPLDSFPSFAEPTDIVPLRVKENRQPNYPRRAERRGVGAVVSLLLDIDAEGRVVMTRVVNVEADRYENDFVRAAERAAMRTRFYPRTENGRPVPVSGVSKTYRFRVQ